VSSSGWGSYQHERIVIDFAVPVTLAGNQLSALTLLTLAWGSQHGDIG
jgi:hypothetical protein